MAIYLVAYDLNQTGQNYQGLIGRLRQMDHFHAQKSLWFVNYSGTSSALRDDLGRWIDANDVIFVDQVTGSWASINMPACGRWLNARGL